MEKSTEPNESGLEQGINEASEISTSKKIDQEKEKSEAVTESEPTQAPIQFDTLELIDYPGILKNMVQADNWMKSGKEIQEVKNAAKTAA